MTKRKGDVFEPFCGSGTCLIACEKLDRSCFAMELNPHYCDVILSRWEAFTGNNVTRTSQSV
jgi:DNA modification methylase